MANENQIILSVEAQEVSKSAKQAVDLVESLTTAAVGAEGKLKLVLDAIKKFGDPNTLRNINLLGRALSGAFSDASLKIKAVQGQLQEFKAQTLNITTEILNAQATSARKISRAVQEAQVQTYMRSGNRGYQNVQDPNQLRLRIQAEQRRIEQAAIDGQKAPRGSQQRLEAMQNQLRQITAQRNRDNSALTESIRLQERLTKLTTEYALARQAGDTGGRYRALSGIADTQAQLRLAQNGYEMTDAAQRAFARADTIGRGFDTFAQQQRAARTATRQTSFYGAEGAAQLDQLGQVRSQISAARAQLRQATSTGADTTQEVTNLRELMSLRRQLTEQATKDRTEAQSAATLQKNLLDAQLRQTTALSEVERQQYKVLEAKLVYREALAKAAGTETVEVRQAAQALADERRQLESLRAAQRGPTSAPKSPQTIAANSMEVQKARFSLNGGADLFRLQTQVLANYQIVSLFLGALRNGAGFVAEFEASMKELQAITGATSGELETLSKKFLEVSQNSKFSGVEIAKAGTIMAQAGLSPTEITDSIQAVLKLATATGTDLKTAVDLATSAMSVFNFRAVEMDNVANMVSAALNVSKLDAQKMALGMQYAGNVAQETGVSFQEMTTALAAMANAGIKSGSTLGTGLRQIIQDLANPSTKLKETLDRLGLSMADVDLRTQGLFGVLQNLHDAGFSTTDALQTMGTRGAAAMSSLFNQLGAINDLQQAIAESGDATKAAATQMDTVEAQWKRFGSTAGALASTVSGPLVTSLKALLSGASDLMSTMTQWSGTLKLVAAIITGAVAAGFTIWIGRLAAGLLGIKQFTAALVTMVEVMTATESVTIGLGAALSLFTKINPLFFALSAAAAVALVAVDKFGGKAEETADQMDKLQTAVDDSKGRVSSYQTSVTALTDEIDKLSAKHARLSSDSGELGSVIAELNNRFKDLGFYVSEGATNVDQLITKLRQLRDEQAKNQLSEMKFQQTLLQGQQDTQQTIINRMFGASGVQSLLSKSGVSDVQLRQARSGFSGPTHPVLSLNGNQNPEIEAAIKIMGQAAALFGGAAPSTPEEIDQTIGAIRGQIKKLVDTKTQLHKDLGSQADGVITEIDGLVNGLTDAQKELAKKQGLGAQIRGNDKNINVMEVATGSLGQQVDDLIEGMKKEVSRIETSFTGKTNADGQRVITDKMVRDHAQALKDLYLSVSKDYQYILSTADAHTRELFKQSPAANAAAAGIETLRSKAQAGGLDVNKLDEEVLNAQKKRIQAQIQETMQKVNGKTPVADIRTLPDTINALFDQLGETERQLAQIKDKQTGIAPTKEHQLARDAEITKANEESRNKDLDKVNQYVQESARKTAEAVDKVERLPESLKEFNQSLTQINDAFKNANKHAQSLVTQHNARIQNMQSVLLGNRDRFSNVEVQQAQFQTEAVQRQADKMRLDNVLATIPQYEAMKRQGAELDARYQARRESLTKEISTETDPVTGNKLNENELAARRAELMEQSRQQLQLHQETAKVEEKLKSLEEQRVDLGNEYNARWGNAGKPMGIGEGFATAWDVYAKQTDNAKSVNATVIDSFTTMFGTVEQGMNQMTMSVLTRSKTIGQAMKGLGQMILETALQVMTNYAVKQMLGFAINFGLGLLGGGAGAASAGATASAGTSIPSGGANMGGPTITFRQGGRIRAAMGRYISGGIPNRDSVPVLAMPGEGILQKSAMDSIGSKFFNDLNTMGAAALRQPIAIPQQEKKEPDTVNVWLVQKDQIPPPGPKDIVAVINDDIMKGGPTKRLIKAVQIGQV